MDEEEVPTFSSVVSATNRNLTRLTRNVAITASTVLSGDQPSLAAPSAYHRAMSEVATYQRRLVASKIRENTPRQAIRQSLVRLGGFRAPQIPDELLIDLPPARTQHSLFQAFEDTAPHATQSTESVPNPRALAVRKEMASSELVEIDERIAELRNLRKLVFERMAEVERMQTSDEPTLQHFYPAGERIKAFTPEPRAKRFGATSGATSGDTSGDTSGEAEPISFVDFNSPFGQLALARGDSVELYELSVDSHTQLRGTQGQQVRCLAVHGSDPIVGSGAGNNVYLWNGSNPEPSELVGHVGPVVGVSLDGASVVSASEDRTVRHWDDKIGKCVGTIDSFAYGTCLSLQHMGNALATGFEDGVVRLWDLREATGSGMAAGRPQRELVGGHTGPVSTLHFTGLELVSGSIDGSVRIWDLRTGQISHAEAYPGPVAALSFDATKVVTAIRGEHGVRVLSRATHEHRISAIEDSTVAAAQYMKGYLVTGRESGEIGVYAV